MRYGVPLLANSIRQAERLAVAMDARGFQLSDHATYYVTAHLTPADWLFLAGVLLVTVTLLVVLAYLGLLPRALVGSPCAALGARHDSRPDAGRMPDGAGQICRPEDPHRGQEPELPLCRRRTLDSA